MSARQEENVLCVRGSESESKSVCVVDEIVGAYLYIANGKERSLRVKAGTTVDDEARQECGERVQASRQ